MTGIWQSRGRHELPVAEMIRLDREYVESWSLAQDLAIMVQTIRAVVTRRGAY
jgi:lipopolysaccharide/colanic/teichoic acid biosynthesis glycosyltransferase